MHRLLFLTAIAIALTTTASGAEPTDGPPPDEASEDGYTITAGSVTSTPEMWFYQQEQRRYDDPKLLVHRKAEIYATQRRNRIAARKWYGLSNQRPLANPTPWYGPYSPGWVAHYLHPYCWGGVHFPAVLVITQ